MPMIEIKPHTAIDQWGYEIRFEQFVVCVNGKTVGYVGTHDNAPLNFVYALPQQLIDEVTAKVIQVKGPIQGVGIPLPIDVVNGDLEDNERELSE
jgi:hypothetical protein